MSFVMIRNQKPATWKRMWTQDDKEDVIDGMLRVIDIKYKAELAFDKAGNELWNDLPEEEYCCIT